MDAASPRKHLKICNFTTTNGINMKLTTTVYLHETLHLAKNWGFTPGEWEGLVEKLLKKSQNIGFLAYFVDFMKNRYSLQIV